MGGFNGLLVESMIGARFMYNGGGGWGGGGDGGQDSPVPGYGPYKALIWENLGSIDPWGLPKITAYRTTCSGGRPAIVFTDGKKHVMYRSLTYEGVTWAWDLFRTKFNLANVASWVGL